MAFVFFARLFWVLGFVLFATASTSTTSTATTSTATPTVYNTSSAPSTAPEAIRRYAYLGCFLEVSGENGTAPGSRTMQQGVDEVLEGSMTPYECLRFCGSTAENNTAAYAYAGLEYSRECWCGADISGLATQEPESDCNLPCDGDKSLLCGGSMRLTVYKLQKSAAAPLQSVGAVAVAALAAWCLL